MGLTKEEFARRHLVRQGNKNPSKTSVALLVQLIEKDRWVGDMYKREVALEKEREENSE